MSEQTPESDPLGAWPDFLKLLLTLPEERCWELLAMEYKGRKRFGYIQRLYGRANKLRTLRERREWFGEQS